ncbi:MAG: hypothetical protein ACYTHN_13565 [Planctomycetota bacterium]|jgi:hypothetical protein
MAEKISRDRRKGIKNPWIQRGPGGGDEEEVLSSPLELAGGDDPSDEEDTAGCPAWKPGPLIRWGCIFRKWAGRVS